MTDTASLSSERYGSSPSSYLSSPPDRNLMLKDGPQLSSIPTQHRPPALSLSTRSNRIDPALPRRPQSSPVMAMNSSRGAMAAVAAKPLLPPTPATSYDHPDEAYSVPSSGKRARSIDIEEGSHSKTPRLGPYTLATTTYDQPDDGFGMSRGRKPTRPIDIEEANHHNTGKLSPYTPSTGRGEGPRELICLCAKAPKVPRPRNAFILYRQAWQGHFAAQHPGLANPEISKLIGEKWREQPESVKKEWKKLAEEEKVRHQIQYPGYKYQPRRGGRNGSGRLTSSSEETSGRCPKCGGRYIATPRTPTTPFSVASPPPSKRPSNMQQPYPSTEHQGHGSISSSMMPVDTSGRRYTQSYYRDVEDDYPILSPMAAPLSGIPPEAKRRRYNGGPLYVPGSPHMGYVSVDPRFQQRPSVSGPPMSATGHGPGHLPRPPPQYRALVYQAHPNNPVMQPPPPPPPPPPTARQSMAYPSAHTPNRPNSGFDESLRLPPLQTQMQQESAAANAEPGGRQAVAAPPGQPQAAGTIITQSAGAVRQQQQAQHQQQSQQPQTQLQLQSHQSQLQQPAPSSPMPQKWPFLLKLEVLRSISPPLRPPGPGGPYFETRGPIIAVEGAPTPVLKEVAAVIERALSVSAEFAVQVWSEDTSTAIAHSSPEPHPHAHVTTTATTTSNNSTSAGSDVRENGNGNGNRNGDSKASENGTDAAGFNGGNAGAVQKKTSLISPIANYVARMLKWHKTSEDLVRYVTTYPSLPSSSPPQDPRISNSNGANNNSHNNNPSNSENAKVSHRLPVAILSDGYSLTFSDRYANALHVNDAYRADDHWQWVATLWRGIVGADLTVYVKKAAAAAAPASSSSPSSDGNSNSSGSSSVEMAGPGIMVIRVPADAEVVGGSGAGRVDEKLERRLGFEIAEWVRGGSFMAGFENRNGNGNGKDGGGQTHMA